MTSDRGTVCFTCGEPTGQPPRLNRLEDGSPCPGCRVRLEEATPPALPGFGAGIPEGYGAPEEVHASIPAGPRPRLFEEATDEGPDGPEAC